MMLLAKIRLPSNIAHSGFDVIEKEICGIEELDKYLNNVGDMICLRTKDGDFYIVHGSNLALFSKTDA